MQSIKESEDLRPVLEQPDIVGEILQGSLVKEIFRRATADDSEKKAESDSEEDDDRIISPALSKLKRPNSTIMSHISDDCKARPGSSGSSIMMHFNPGEDGDKRKTNMPPLAALPVLPEKRTVETNESEDGIPLKDNIIPATPITAFNTQLSTNTDKNMSTQSLDTHSTGAIMKYLAKPSSSMSIDSTIPLLPSINNRGSHFSMSSGTSGYSNYSRNNKTIYMASSNMAILSQSDEEIMISEDSSHKPRQSRSSWYNLKAPNRRKSVITDPIIELPSVPGSMENKEHVANPSPIEKFSIEVKTIDQFQPSSTPQKIFRQASNIATVEASPTVVPQSSNAPPQQIVRQASNIAPIEVSPAVVAQIVEAAPVVVKEAPAATLDDLDDLDALLDEALNFNDYYC
jgi:hypothetical protein